MKISVFHLFSRPVRLSVSDATLDVQSWATDVMVEELQSRLRPMLTALAAERLAELSQTLAATEEAAASAKSEGKPRDAASWLQRSLAALLRRIAAPAIIHVLQNVEVEVARVHARVLLPSARRGPCPAARMHGTNAPMRE